MTRSQAVVIDTDAFSLLFIRPSSLDPRVPLWREMLTGKQIFISFQTRSEILEGVAARGWGARRTTEVRQLLDRIPTINTNESVIEAHSILGAECRRAGHALHNKVHTGDRWIAACAIANNVSLLAGDQIYNNVPGLRLLRSDTHA